MNDLRFALRQLWRNPVFATVTVVSMALGIGAVAAIFSFPTPTLPPYPAQSHFHPFAGPLSAAPSSRATPSVARFPLGSPALEVASLAGHLPRFLEEDYGATLGRAASDFPDFFRPRKTTCGGTIYVSGESGG